MIIGGLQKFSLLDYPGKVSAIVFTQGCNFRCQFCYNPMLVWPIGEGKLKYDRELTRESGSEPGQQKVHPKINPTDAKALVDKQDDLFVFLEARVGKLDAVVITGGEPCLQKDLIKFIKKIRDFGYLIKLDTNGGYPEILTKLIKEKLINYIAMDLKAPESKYGEVAGIKVDFNNIKKSVKIIKESGLPYEFRTTVVPDLLDKEDISEMGKIIRGAPKWYLQNFKSQSELVNKDLKGKVPYNGRQMKEMAEIGRQYVKNCQVR